MGRGQVHLLIIEKKNEHPLLAKGVRQLECFLSVLSLIYRY